MPLELEPPSRLLDVGLAVNARPLEEFLNTIAFEMNRMARQHATLNDDVRILKAQVLRQDNESGDALAQIRKALGVHDTTVRELMQTTVTETRLENALQTVASKVRDVEAIAKELRSGAHSGDADVVGLPKVQTLIDQYDKEVAMPRVEEMTKQTQRALTTALEAHTDRVTGQIHAAVDPIRKDRVGLVTLGAMTEALQTAAAKAERDARLTSDRFLDMQAAMERAIDDVLIVMRQIDQRVADVSINVAPLVVEDAVDQQNVEDPPASKKGPVPMPPRRTSGAAAPPAVVPAAPSTRPGCTDPSSPSRTGGGGTPMTAGLPSAVDAQALLKSEPRQALSMLQSPAFTTFRQQLLQDMRDRVGLANQDSNMASEEFLVDLRLDIKQRTTSDRVVDLIHQHRDQETPARMAKLQQHVARIEREKVSHADLLEELRTKGDVLTLEQKADKVALQQHIQDVADRLAEMETAIDTLLSEREEFRDVLRDVVYMHRRQQAVGRDSPATRISPQQSPKNTHVTLPNIPTSRRSAGGSVPSSNGNGPAPPPSGSVDPRPRWKTKEQPSGMAPAAQGGRAATDLTPESLVKGQNVAYTPTAAGGPGSGVGDATPAGGRGGSANRADLSSGSDGAPPSAAAAEYERVVGAPAPRGAPRFSGMLKEPGDRELLPVKSAMAQEPAHRDKQM